MNRHRQKKKILGPGFQVSVSLYLYFFFLFLRAAETLRFALLGFWKEMERLVGRSVLGLCGRWADMIPVWACVLLHARASFTVAAEDVVRFILGECARKGFGFLGVEMGGILALVVRCC